MIVGLGSFVNGILCEDGFDIIVVFEIMVILCLVIDLLDLKKCLLNIVVVYLRDCKLIYVKDLKIEGVFIFILKDVIKFNLV